MPVLLCHLYEKVYRSYRTLGGLCGYKKNAPEILRRQIRKAPKGNIMISSVTDPYQPMEGQYELTRQCLEILAPHPFSLSILTKSPLVLRDMDLLKKFEDHEVGLTITTDDEEIRKIFEPNAPPVEARIQALKRLHENGIHTYAFIGPLLPMNPEALAEKIKPYVHHVWIDRMNYVSRTLKIYKSMRLAQWLEDDFTDPIIYRLQQGFTGKDIRLC